MPDGTKYRAILLFGMPGSGKGTQGSVLGQLPDFVHISSGDLFRKLPKHGELGREVLHYSSQGLLVPDDLTLRIYQRHIKILELQELLLPEQHTLILDGLPRNYSQAAELDHMLQVIQIFHLNITDTEQAKDRLRARALRENRLDDISEDVIARRLKLYYQETYETLKFYDPSLIFEVEASRTPIEVLSQIVDRLVILERARIKPHPPQALTSHIDD